MFPGLAGPSNIWEWNAHQFGLALSWGLTHADNLKDPNIEPDEGAWAERRRQDTHRAKQLEILVEYKRLQEEAMEAGEWYGDPRGASARAWKLSVEAVRRKSSEAGPSNG